MDTVTALNAGTTYETVELRQHGEFRFAARFGPAIPELIADEPLPLGQGAGPSPVQLLAAAVGNCLSASLYFALTKFHQSPEPITATVKARVGRNGQKRLRVLGLHARLRLGSPAAEMQHLDRALERFEDYCTVTASVRMGIPVEVEVFDGDGRKLK